MLSIILTPLLSAWCQRGRWLLQGKWQKLLTPGSELESVETFLGSALDLVLATMWFLCFTAVLGVAHQGRSCLEAPDRGWLMCVQECLEDWHCSAGKVCDNAAKHNNNTKSSPTYTCVVRAGTPSSGILLTVSHCTRRLSLLACRARDELRRLHWPCRYTRVLRAVQTAGPARLAWMGSARVTTAPISALMGRTAAREGSATGVASVWYVARLCFASYPRQAQAQASLR